MNPIKYGRDIHFNPEGLPGEIGYFLVFPYPHELYHTKKKSEQQPYIITFRDDETLMGDLLEQFAKKHDTLKEKSNLYFELTSSKKICNKRSVAELAKKVQSSSVDGLILHVREREKKAKKVTNILLDSDDSDSYEDECAMQDFLGEGEGKDEPFKINLNFQLPDSKGLCLSVRVRPESNPQNIIKQFEKDVQHYFKIDVGTLKGVRYSYQHNKKDHQFSKSDNESKTEGMHGISNWKTITMYTDEKVEFKVTPQRPSNRLIIYLENSDQYISEIFQEVQFMSFRNLYLSKLAPESQKKDKDTVRCLKVMDLLIRSNENFSKLTPYFRINEQANVVNLVGRVVSEKMHFHKTMAEVAQVALDKFKIDQHIVSKEKENKEVFRQRIRKKCEDRAKTAEEQHFKDINNVEPILVYTSEEIHYKADNSDKTEPVYSILNRNMRESSLIMKEKDEIAGDWKISFASLLLKQISNIKSPLEQNQKVYRGVDYDPKVQQGGIITFKSFLSTSSSKKVAEDFLKQSSSKEKSSGQKTLFIMNIRGGKSIKNYSDFKYEEEILLEPYTQFRVVSVQQKQEKTVPNRIVQLTQLSEEESSAVYPETKANFIIWVDDKKGEGAKIYSQIKAFKHPTILFQLQSTKQLADWLKEEKVKKILVDPTSHIVFISNMTRQGNGIAGIEGIIELQKAKSHKDIPIFMYIGYLKGTQEKLAAHKEKLNNYKKIQVGNQLTDIEHFLMRSIQIDFKVLPTGKPQLFKAFSNPEEKSPEKSQKSEKEKMNKTWANAGTFIEPTKQPKSNIVQGKKDKECLLM